MRMSRVNVYVPDDLHRQAKRARLNVSELCQEAIRAELARRERFRAMGEWAAELTDRHGSASPEEIAEAEAWANQILAAAKRAEGARRKPRRPRRAA
jgi:post-segregation antitoxin (ccd killing protein)